MRKGHSLIGSQVIAQSDGSHLGKVTDLFFDHDADQCLGFVLRDRELFGMLAPQVVPWEAVQSIGKDAIMVTAPSVVINPSQDARLRTIWERENKLSGTRIFTEDGRDLGTFSEVYMDENTGRVLGYEVSGGFVSDTMSGKRYVSAAKTHDLHVGADVLLADPGVATEFERQATEEPGGLTKAYQDVANASVEKQQQFVVGKTAGNDVFLPAPEGSSAENGPILVREGEVISEEHATRATDAGILHSLVTAASAHAARTQYDAARGHVGGAAAGHQQDALERAVGERAAFDVDLADGSTLIASGMTITREMTQQARVHGVENKVIAAAGLGSASENAQAAGAQVAQGAGTVWDTVKTKTQELLGTAHEKKAEYDEMAEQNQINAALGRPVTRVILAQDDSVILNTGDIITHKAVEHARREQMLDVLLDSVFASEPDITPEMMRLEQPGEDALPSQADPDAGPHTATVITSKAAQPMPAQDTPSQG